MSYFKITTKGPTQDEVLAYLTRMGRRAIVADQGNSVAMIWDEEFNGGIIWRRFARGDVCLPGMSAWEPVVRGIARELDCVALAVEIIDSDVLYYELYVSDHLIDECVADRANVGRTYWYPMPPNSAAMLNNDHAALLCAAFGVPERRAAVESILKSDGYTVVDDRHGDLVNALGVSTSRPSMNFQSAVHSMKVQEEERWPMKYRKTF